MEQQRDELATKKDLKKVEQALTSKIDENSKKIDHVEQTLSEKIDRVEQTLTSKIDENSKKIDENSKKIDRVTARVVENSTEISKMLTKEEFRKHFNEIVCGQDKMMVILQRIDQEGVVTRARIERIEAYIEANKTRQYGT